MSRKLRHRSHHGSHSDNQNDITGAEDQESANQLEQLAYEYWQERGSPFGSPEEDWFRAEKELQRREQAAARL